jgi:IS5 family transposase
MLRERAVGESLWEAVLPDELRELPSELGKVGALLDEERFLEPFRRRLTATVGRPTIPVETFLRLAYLKHRYGLGWRRCARRSLIRLRGGGFVGSRSMDGCLIRQR